MDACRWIFPLCFLIAVVTTAHGQSTEGFISIDCGHAGEGYQDSRGVSYEPDGSYVETGVNRITYNPDFARRFGDLRSFPNGTRNCYTIPVRRGVKYLVRAGFVYGNYDGLNQPPVFHLYLGVTFWQSVTADSILVEIIAVAPAASMQVCLVNNGTGTPFISVLELRPLAVSMYGTLVNASQSLLLHRDRYNYGGRHGAQLKYPDDPYDRIWFTPDDQAVAGWKLLSSNNTVIPSELFRVPSTVLRTAVTAESLSGRLNFTVTGSLGDQIYLMMHFTELQRLGQNESRVFDVYMNSDILFKAYRPEYLQAGVLSTNNPRAVGTVNYSLAATGNSTLPPILNALEVYTLLRVTQLPTAERDVAAILNIKRSYKLVRNWEGDPCAPKQFMWEGLTCSFDASENPRITSLNLSRSGLAGEILASIANLTALRSLDLSDNKLTGEIPGRLGELPALVSLNLRSNQLSGSLPQILANKSKDGSLSLSIDDNPVLCRQARSCTEVTKEKKNKKTNIVPIIISASVSLVLLPALLILVYCIRRARTRGGGSKTQGTSTKQPKPLGSHRQKDRLIRTQGHHLKFSEILSITNNFEREIGKGGFGIVYLGHLPDKTPVAVKLLSQSSSQGAKEFQAEASVLTRVHHKNLVSLLGYCNDKNNLALVYEFMPQGSLAGHLHGNTDTVTGLCWRMRLKIAVDSAQGLDYLHNGCKPSIVHRDVKTANILLDENFGAKLADFGLSREFINEEDTHISTGVAGTLGYLDPEYYQTRRLNEKNDIYSFGVVLLELITGRMPVVGGAEKMHITQWVLSRIEEGDIDSIADHRLQKNYDTNSIWKAVDVAMACVSSPSTQRPTMSEVVVQLRDCLALETESSCSQSLRMQSRKTMEALSLNMDSSISLSGR